MTTSVRRATPADAAAIAEVHGRSWQVAYRGIVPDDVLDGLSVVQRERVWADLLARDDGGPLVLVGEHDGHVIGFCSALTQGRDDPDHAEITAIYVDPGHWRAGAGSALLGAALAELRAAHCAAVRLWVFAGNERALAFYRCFGFAADGAEMIDESSGRGEIRLRAPLPG